MRLTICKAGKKRRPERKNGWERCSGSDDMLTECKIGL